MFRLSLAAIIMVAGLLFTAHNLLAGDYGYSNSNEVGQQNNVTVNTNSGSYGQAKGYWAWQPYRYWHRGRWYTSQRQVWVEGTSQGGSYGNSNYADAKPTQVTPIGAVNTDYSSTHNYTYNITYGQLPTGQGSTLYGQPANYSEVADIYGNVDFGVLFDQALRVTNDAGALYAKAHSGALDVINQASDRQAHVAQILAEGQRDTQRLAALAELAKAATPPSVYVQRSAQYGSGQTTVAGTAASPSFVGEVKMTTSTATLGRDLGKLQAVFNASCVKCHGGVKTEGGLDLRDVSQLDAKAGDNIYNRLTTPDDKLRMPRNGDGTPGTLDRDSMRTVLMHLQ